MPGKKAIWKAYMPQEGLIGGRNILPHSRCYFTHTWHTHIPIHTELSITALYGSISLWKSGSSYGFSHWKKVKLPGRMAITPLKWYYQWNMIDQLNSIAQKSVGLSRVLYAQWVEAWCSFQVHFASLLPPDQAINRGLAYHISPHSRRGENIICCKFRMTDL